MEKHIPEAPYQANNEVPDIYEAGNALVREKAADDSPKTDSSNDLRHSTPGSSGEDF